MWLNRFKPMLLDLLRNADHPDIERVETWQSNEKHPHTNIVVHCKDGRSIYLWITQTSPPGGEDRAKPERIVTKDQLTETQLAARRKGKEVMISR